MTMDILLQADDVWKRFGRHDVLQGLTLAVPAGSAYALIGANGAGKSTTLKLLMNIVAPSRGVAAVFGVDTRLMSPQLLAQIGYVSESQVLPGRLTVAQYIDYVRPFYPAWDRDLETSIRAVLRLPDGRRIGQLSHGQRIKVALACALPYRPKLLILDEPFSGLDPLVREEFMEGLLSQSSETTMVISSHELGEIENFTTHVGFLDSGRLLFEESMADMSARIREVRVTLAQTAVVPERAPEEWLHVRAVGNVLSFVDTRFSETGMNERLRTQLGPVRRIDVQPLPLRSIFTTLARAAREGGIR